MTLQFTTELPLLQTFTQHLHPKTLKQAEQLIQILKKYGKHHNFQIYNNKYELIKTIP